MAAATPAAPPIVVGQATDQGHVIQWEIPPDADPDSFTVEVWRNGTLERVVDLPGEAREFVNDALGGGIFQYVVYYVEDGEASAPGLTTLPGYPWCMNIIGFTPEWPFLIINDHCLFPLPVP